MSDCSNHKKEVAGISDMKVLAEMIGDLHYRTLDEFLKRLAIKINDDALNDYCEGRKSLADNLTLASHNIRQSSQFIYKAWKISKPFMEDKKQ